jgi:hypothetical protein
VPSTTDLDAETMEGSSMTRRTSTRCARWGVLGILAAISLLMSVPDAHAETWARFTAVNETGLELQAYLDGKTWGAGVLPKESRTFQQVPIGYHRLSVRNPTVGFRREIEVDVGPMGLILTVTALGSKTAVGY